MARHEVLSVILASILTSIALITLILSFMPSPWKFPVLFVSIGVFLIFIFLYFYFYSRRREEQTGASLKISVLPFYKGYPTPPSPGVKKVNPDGSTTVTVMNDSRATTSQVQYLAPSQLFVLWKGEVGSNMSEFVAKFGVIRFEVIKGYVKGCRVGVKYREIKEMNDASVSKWSDGGYLNWFSPMIKQGLIKCNLFEKMLNGMILNGINSCLKNEAMDLFQGEEKDLLLFYVIRGSPMVYLCSTLDNCVIGYAAVESMPLKFELKLTIVGENLLTVVRVFKISAVWDDFKIEEMYQ